MTGTTGDREDGHCADALEAMYLFIDHEELTSVERAQVQAHLDECIPCLEAFEFEAEFKLVIKQRCREDLPPHLEARIRALLVQVNAEQRE